MCRERMVSLPVSGISRGVSLGGVSLVGLSSNRMTPRSSPASPNRTLLVAAVSPHALCMTITPLPLPRLARGNPLPPAVLVFPGQGSQWAGMDAELLDSSPVFHARLRECASAVARYVAWDVEDVLRRRPGAPTLGRVEMVQPV